MTRHAAALCCLGLLLICPQGSAQEWTRFRGPNGDGQSDSQFPAEWSGQSLAWKTTLSGVGHSSPVLWGNKIFLTSAEPAEGRRSLLCLDAANDGKLLWKQDFPFQTYKVHAQNGYATSTPAVDVQHVYCSWATPEQYFTVALDHSGKEVWRVEFGPYASQHGFGTSPIVYEDLLIVTNDQDGDSSLMALNRHDGAIKWRIPRQARPEQNASYAVPCIFQPAKGAPELIVNSWFYGITSIDPKNGKTNWELPAFPRRPVASPIIVDGLILGSCGEGSGNNTMVAVRPGSKNGGSPEQVYKLDKTSAPYVPTMVAAGDLVFLWGDRGVVTCIDGKSGSIHWRERVGGNFSGSPVRAGDKIYCISADGEVVVLAASKEYKLLGRNPLNELSRSTPAIVGSHMYLRTESHLVCLNGTAPASVKPTANKKKSK
jgi:outer membrane protein assembly factor BamB